MLVSVPMPFILLDRILVVLPRVPIIISLPFLQFNRFVLLPGWNLILFNLQNFYESDSVIIENCKIYYCPF